MDAKPAPTLSAYTALSRPTTAAVIKMLNKLVPFARSHKKYAARDLQGLIDRLSRDQQRALQRQKQLVEAFSAWSADLPGADTSALMTEFVQLLDAVGVMQASHADRLNTLKVHLGAISTRELRQHALLCRHKTLQRNLDAAALKHGPQAQQTTMCLDEIEENEYNLKLIEQQLVRTAAASLREACRDYVAWLHELALALDRDAVRLMSPSARPMPYPRSNYPYGLLLSGSVPSSRVDLPRHLESPRNFESLPRHLESHMGRDRPSRIDLKEIRMDLKELHRDLNQGLPEPTRAAAALEPRPRREGLPREWEKEERDERAASWYDERTLEQNHEGW